MCRRSIVLTAVILFLGTAQIACGPASARDFYDGKTLTIVVGSAPGGGYDQNARLVAHYIGKYIPGHPNVIVQNMPGAGSLTSVRYLATTAPRDGTVIDAFQFGLIGQSRLAPNKVPFDFRKFAWIGNISDDHGVCYVWHTLGVKTFADLRKHNNIHFGMSGVGADSDILARILRTVLGADVREISGYTGSADVRLAIERGELDGECGAWSSIPQNWIRTKLIYPIFYTGKPVPADMPPGVPDLMALVSNKRQRSIVQALILDGELDRPFIASANVPKDRIQILRQAFTRALEDPNFLAQAEKERLPVGPKTGEDDLKTVEAIYSLPDDVVEAARKIMSR